MLETVVQGNMQQGRRTGRKETNSKKNISIKNGGRGKVNSSTAEGGRNLLPSEQSRTDNW